MLVEASMIKVVLWVLVAACVPALLVGFAGVLPESSSLAGSPAAFRDDLLERTLLIVGDSAVTAVVEELVFRGLLLYGLVWAFRAIDRSAPSASAVFRAAVLQAVAFALAHVLGLDISLEASSPVAALQFFAKFAQAFLFAVCMAYLLLKTANLIFPILVHFAFNSVYFAPTVLMSGSFPETYLTGSLFDLSIVLISAVILGIPALRMLIEAKRGESLGLPRCVV